MPPKNRTIQLDKIMPTLKNLPRQPGQVLVGGKRTLDIYIREGNEYLKPQLALWLDQNWGMVLNSEVITPSKSSDHGITETLNGIIQAIIGPYSLPPNPPPPGSPPYPQPGLPERIVVNDKALANAANILFAPLGIPVEYSALPIPAFEEAFAEASVALGADPDMVPPEPFEWLLEDEENLPLLYEAAAGFWRRKPWYYTGSDFPFEVELGTENGPDHKTTRLYPVVLGNAGMVIGVAFYFSLTDFKKVVKQGEKQTNRDALIEEGKEVLRQAGSSIDHLPEQVQERIVIQELGQELGLTEPNSKQKREKLIDSLVLFYDPIEESDPEYLEWLKARGFKYPLKEAVPTFHRMVPGKGGRLLNSQEVKAVALALSALNQFFSAVGFLIEGLQPAAKGYYDHQAKVGKEKVRVGVRYPAAGYEEQYLQITVDNLN